MPNRSSICGNYITVNQVVIDVAGKAFEKDLAKTQTRIRMSFHKLRHVNASIMAFLNDPERYALERGGWKSDKVMKNVYTHAFSDRRVETDDVVDRYFESALGINKDPADSEEEKYKAWLILFDRQDDKKSMRDFKKFMQHEMQHEN